MHMQAGHMPIAKDNNNVVTNQAGKRFGSGFYMLMYRILHIPVLKYGKVEGTLPLVSIRFTLGNRKRL